MAALNALRNLRLVLPRAQAICTSSTRHLTKRQSTKSSTEVLSSGAPGITSQRRNSSSGAYDGDGKTTVQIMNKEAEYGLLVDSYSPIGFELNTGLMVLGPIAVFPRTVLSWNVWLPQDINEESLSLFYMLAPKLDLLVIGVGEEANMKEVARKELVNVMHEHRMGIEILPTHQAITTFNFLNAEGRSVAGAFIPPKTVTTTADDAFLTMKKRRALYITREDD